MTLSALLVYVRSLLVLIATSGLPLFAQPPASNTPVWDASGFTFTPPDGFDPLPQVVSQNPSIMYAYGRMGSARAVTIVAIERLKGPIGRESMESFVPKDRLGMISKAAWQGFTIDVFEVVEQVNGSEFVTYNAQVPLKPFAVQVKVFGPGADRAALRTLLDTMLRGLNGQTNWYRSLLPASISGSPNYATYLLIALIVFIVIGLTGLYLIGRRAPRGTVFVIAMLLIMLGLAIPSSPVRELLLLRGGLRMTGVIGLLLGVIELVRRRRRGPAAAAAKQA
ncbi:MAG: hypothetical protein QM783_11005 [Phycisphaerales bacterium]